MSEGQSPEQESRDAWGYVRLSQSGREGTLEDQKQAIRDYCRREGLNLQTTRNDGKRTSGFDPDRDEYRLLREQIRDGAIDVVVTRDRARLSRDFDDRLALLTEFRETGVEWHVVEAGGRLGVDDVQTAGMECLHAMMDHVKKKVEIERAREATQDRLDRGLDHGRPPFGMAYDDAGEHWVPAGGFETALDVIEMREDGASWSEIVAETELDRSKCRRIYERADRYLDEAS